MDVDDEGLPRYVVWLGFSALIGSMIIRLVDLWRLNIERDYYARLRQDESAVLSYPWLAQHPVWDGIIVGSLAFAVGAYLIYGYHRTLYLRPEPEPLAAPS